MPGEQSGGLGNFYHSWDYGPIHFVSMCTEDYIETYQPGSRQYKWLESVYRPSSLWDTPI